jgi:DNA adenine methylase
LGLNYSRNLGGAVLSAEVQPQPFLRWAGGKRKLAGFIANSFPTKLNYDSAHYYEPFLGGGALAFYIGQKESPVYIPGSRIHLSDMNPDLISAYQVLRDDPLTLMRHLIKLGKNTDREAFEKVRSSRPNTKIEIAARFIYLNKTCFNGLWRVNSKGEFNVPWGKLQNPRIFDEAILLANSKRLSGAKIAKRDYLNQLELAKKGDLVYLDPPYIPLSSSSSFSKYSKLDFDLSNHEQLASCINSLTKRGVFVVLSNSDTSDTRRIFGETMNLYQISVGRSISAKSESRKRVNEIIATNYDVDSISDVGLLKRIK